MPAPTHPSDVAREVLRLFAARRLPPTPDNFRTLYHEVAGTEADEAFAPGFVGEIAIRLPRDTAERAMLARQLDQALVEGNATVARKRLLEYLDQLQAEQPPAWNTLISNLLRQWEQRHIGWTTARKRESLERVLSSSDPTTLHGRLQGLLGAWTKAPVSPETSTILNPMRESDFFDDEPTPPTEVRLVAPGEAGDVITHLRELLVIAFESVVPAFLREYPYLVREAERFAEWIKAGDTPAQLRNIAEQMRKFAYRLEIAAGDVNEIRAGQLNLLKLLLENIEEIVIDAQWIKGQVEALREIVDETPTDIRRIDDAERRLRELIWKQSQLKHNLVEAQRSLRELLSGFVDQLARFTESTSAYHDKIAVNAGKIAEARDITEISPLLDEVMRDTRVVQEEARRARDELQAARDRARETERHIAELQQKLDEASRLMRHDQLTGMLNRRGLEETFAKEAARAQRKSMPLCMARLDIDDFRKVSEAFGYAAGEDALVHLATVVRKHLGPEETVARLDGEEFIVLYPDADLDKAAAALVRLQRELTRTYFMANEDRILITFSAGVTTWISGEPIDDLIRRADEAMHRAKSSGRNKVVSLPAHEPR